MYMYVFTNALYPLISMHGPRKIFSVGGGGVSDGYLSFPGMGWGGGSKAYFLVIL